ncbi:hypothetical protein JTE90_006595 [Oedothorax gibbosus]|uniref:PWWP domain-containing protein n=1 Tax=Oedothorax gibbosus TaxID=931172 RepID=A0AAV6U2S5_9ARAC|nr:hypothetical protein JTE90_006595 [Oedothorax gibbosus]
MDDFHNEYDSDDSLPPISKLFPQPTEFLEGQIVWAKYKELYWPSLIRKVYKKEKKVSLWYLDSAPTTFKVAFKNLHRYNDIDFSTEVKRAASASPLKILHDKVLEATMDFVYRRSDGHEDDPAEFFARNVPKEFVFKVRTSAKQKGKVETKVSGPLQKGLDETFEDLDEESVTDSEDEEEKRKQRMELFAELSLTDNDYCPEPRVNAMVECITTGHVDKHLIDIMSHKVPCVRQETFEQSQNILRQGNSFPIHIKDNSKDKAIYDYLESFYKRADGKWSMFTYVTNVLMPEAMIEALKLVDNGWTPGPALSDKRNLFEDNGVVEEEKGKPKTTSPRGKKKAQSKKRKDGENSKTVLKKSPRKKKPQHIEERPMEEDQSSITVLRKSPRKKVRSLEEETPLESKKKSPKK